MLELLVALVIVGLGLFTFGAAMEGWGFWRFAWIGVSLSGAYVSDGVLGMPGLLTVIVAAPAVFLLGFSGLEALAARLDRGTPKSDVSVDPGALFSVGRPQPPVPPSGTTPP